MGYCGYPGAPALGRLGIGALDDRVVELEKRARAYADGRTVLPVLELIATMVHGSPGADGTFRTRVDPAVIDTHLAAARKHQALLLLNIQPGRASFLAEVRAYEEFLRQPDVGVALDPEWAMEPGQVPGRVYGRTTGAELDGVARYLAGLVARDDLPEKVMVYHQLHPTIVSTESALRDHPGVTLVKSVDGIGPKGAKIETWRRIVARTPKHVRMGFKLFYEEDTGLMSPKQVLRLRPKPAVVVYE